MFQVKWNVYLHYLKSIGLPLSIAAILLNIAFQAFAIGSNIWLSVWSDDKEATNSNGTQVVGKRDLYLGVYAALGLGQGKPPSPAWTSYYLFSLFKFVPNSHHPVLRHQKVQSLSSILILSLSRAVRGYKL